jgi:hypothetical protein
VDMSGKHDLTQPTELELDANDLIEMSLAEPSAPSIKPSPHAPIVHIATEEERAALGAPLPGGHPADSSTSHPSTTVAPRVLCALGLVLVVAAGLVAHRHVATEHAVPSVAQAWAPLPEPDQTLIEEEEPEAPTPTLFANPFDPTEVFELAPGLSEEEAREQVAEILLERARQRMASR